MYTTKYYDVVEVINAVADTAALLYLYSSNWRYTSLIAHAHCLCVKIRIYVYVCIYVRACDSNESGEHTQAQIRTRYLDLLVLQRMYI